MNISICPRCGVKNSPEMAFCTNCGQSLAAPAALQPDARQMPPNYSPPAAPSQAPTVAMPATAPAKSSKGLIFGLLGCGGLLVLSLVGLIIGGVFIGLKDVGQSNSKANNSKANDSNTGSSISNSRIYNSNGISIEQLESAALDEMRGLKQVGAFRQTDVKTVPAGDAYPSASEAVQVTYQNGKQSVISTAAQFASNEAAIADFDARMKNVKDSGGKIYNNMSQEGNKGSAYKYKDYYFIEACGEAVCWRNYSSELNAVKNFAVNFPGGSAKTAK